MEKSPLKSLAISTIRTISRGYIRYAPWRAGRYNAYRVYRRYADRHPYRTVAQTCHGDVMELTLPDLVSSTIFITGQWEPVITRYIQSRLNPGDVFVDCGANVGYYSLVASRIVGDKGRVFSIEASPSIFERLARNVRLNHRSNVTPIHAAASNQKGELSMFLADGNNLGNSTTVQTLAVKEGMSFEGKVQADTLEQLVGKKDLYSARFIKIDVEGAEGSVLSPLYESLHRFNRKTEWLLELSPKFGSDVNQIFDAFVSAGYGIYRIANGYQADFWLYPPRKTQLKRLTSAPTEQCDVVISRDDLDGKFIPR